MSNHAKYCQDPNCGKPTIAERWVKAGDRVKVKPGPGDFSPSLGVVVDTDGVGLLAPKCFYTSVKGLDAWGPYYPGERGELWDFDDDEPVAQSVDGTDPDPLRQLVNDLRTERRYALADELCALLNTRDRERYREPASPEPKTVPANAEGMMERERGAWELQDADAEIYHFARYRPWGEQSPGHKDKALRFYDRAEQLFEAKADARIGRAERERDEARSEVERLTKERYEAITQMHIECEAKHEAGAEAARLTAMNAELVAMLRHFLNNRKGIVSEARNFGDGWWEAQCAYLARIDAEAGKVR